VPLNVFPPLLRATFAESRVSTAVPLVRLEALSEVSLLPLPAKELAALLKFTEPL
jgi:hypothetical protein